MTLAVAILGLLTALLGLLRWWLKRDRPPTPEEEKDAVRRQFQDSFENVYRLRNEGNHEEADAMLRRIAAALNKRVEIRFVPAEGKLVRTR